MHQRVHVLFNCMHFVPVRHSLGRNRQLARLPTKADKQPRQTPLAAKLSYMRHESCPPVPVAHTEYPFSRFIYLLQIYEGDEEDFDDINYATFAVLLKVAFSVGVSNQFKEMTLNLIQIENTFNPI